MKKNFNKDDYRIDNAITKVIIDTDPGVDDIACLSYAFFDENVEIKLLTTVAGNVNVNLTTRNLLHILDVYDLDIPVAKGASRALKRISPTAEDIHKKNGMGGYVPPKTTKRKVIDKDAVEAMYDVLINGEGDIVPVMLGPQTNLGKLLVKHPDVIKKIPKIVVMGGSPFGHPDYPDHISFNISSDPEAFKIVLESKIPILLIPSNIGRYKAHLSEEFVYSLSQYGDIGKFLCTAYTGYWEPKAPDKRVTTNDSCALLALIYPKMFKTEKVSVVVDTEKALGKTHITFDGVGHIDMVTDVDREIFLEFLVSELKSFMHIKTNI